MPRGRLWLEDWPPSSWTPGNKKAGTDVPVSMAPSVPVTPSIQEAIDEQNAHSEVLIAGVQLALVALIGGLYFFADKGFETGRSIEPVPIVVAIWLPLSFLRLVLARKRWLPPWTISLGIVFEVAMLTALIWSFHIQYMQPMTFSLRAPSFAMYFLLIGLRALRYESRYVIQVGLASIVGWLTLTVMAGLEAERTMSFARYVNDGGTLLVGVEVERLLMLALVTVVIAMAVRRGRSLLAREVAEASAVSTLSRFFNSKAVENILGDEEELRPGQGRSARAVVLTMDLRGFSGYCADRDAQEVMSLLVDYQAQAVPIIDAHGGMIDKFLGDGILCWFGLDDPNVCGSHGAMTAAVEVANALEAWKVSRQAQGQMPLDFGIALAAGMVNFGLVGSAARLEFTAIGDPVNVAAKLEKHSKILNARIVATRDVVEAAWANGWQGPQDPQYFPASRVEGLDEPVDLVVLA